MTARHIDAMHDARPIVPAAPATIGYGTARILRFVRVSTMAMLAVLLFTVVLLRVAPLGNDGNVYSGVRIADIEVGGLSEAAALELVQSRTVALAEQPVMLSFDGQTLTPRPRDLGITYDAETSVDAAMAYGRKSGTTHGFMNAASRDEGSAMIPLSIQFNADQFNAYLDGIQARLGSGPRDASVAIDGTDVVVTPAVDGWGIDRAAVQTALLDQIGGLSPVAVTSSRLRQSAAITTEQAVAVKGVIDRALAEQVTLTLGSEAWTITPEQLAAAVRVKPNGDGLLAAALDPADVDAMVATIAKNVDAGATDAWVQDLGTHQWLVPAKQGRTLQRDDLAQLLGLAFAHGEHTIGLVAPESQSPKVTTEALMAKMGITDLIATGDSVFAGSGTGRTHNVTEAAYLIDGTLVPSGGVFSFNDAVGSLFTGEFEDAGSYIDGPTGQSLGGGVCQVSTTVYRAALQAGLPIVELWPHSYRSPFYEIGGWSPGYDAAIVQDSGTPAESTDFRFENTTGSWLLVRAFATDDGNLRVELHGTNPGTTVRFDEPVSDVIETAPTSVSIVADAALPPGTVLPDQPAMDGLRVTVVRHVYAAEGQEISTDTFVSSYKASAVIRRVSPDME